MVNFFCGPSLGRFFSALFYFRQLVKSSQVSALHKNKKNSPPFSAWYGWFAPQAELNHLAAK